MLFRSVTELREAERELLLEADLRRILAITLQRVPPDAHADQIAAELCDGLVSRQGIDFAAVLASTAEGLRPIAWRGTVDLAGPGVDFADLMHVLESGTQSPWATLSTGPDHDDRLCRALTRDGLHATAFAPILHGDHTDGVLVIGTFDQDLAATFVHRMPDRKSTRLNSSH